MTETYDKDYYENGVEKRVSGYTDYHWKPDYVLPMANSLKAKLKPFRVLDYGCAKGYLVKAFRLLGVRAFGYDISKYAIDNADEDVKAHCSNTMASYGSEDFDLVIAKDTLEHVSKEDMPGVLKELFRVTEDTGTVLVVVPLGDNGQYRIREYELDVTHKIREDEVWWIKTFNTAGFNVDRFYYKFSGIKEQWTSTHPYGNGIFFLSKDDNRVLEADDNFVREVAEVDYNGTPITL